MALLLFQGDSITDANRMREDVQVWNRAHRLGTGYVNYIAAALTYRQPENNWQIINKGMAGNRIRDLYARTQEDIINIQPDLLSILIGINEVWCKMNQNCGTVEPDRFKTVYALMIEEIQDKLQIPIVVLEPFLLPGSAVAQYADWMDYLQPLQSVTRSVAETYSCIFIPLQERFDAACQKRPADYWLWDGIHPTAAGHALIADIWLNEGLPKWTNRPL